MKQSYHFKYKSLLNEIQIFILNKIEKKGTKSEFSTQKSLKILDDNLMFNIEGGRWLIEITPDCLIDNEGYQYNYEVITTENLCAIADYIKHTYK